MRKRSAAGKGERVRVDLGFCNGAGSRDDDFPDLSPDLPEFNPGGTRGRPIGIRRYRSKRNEERMAPQV
jgi:hypothetical protein